MISSVVRDNLSVEDTQQIIGNDILDVMLQRCKLHYGMDLSVNNRIFAEAFSQDSNSANTDLFFFWACFQILMVLDEEENSSLRKEQTWVKNGLVDVFERYSTEYREEKNGRIRVFCEDHKDRLLKRLSDVTILYGEV